nr:MAG TPA: hypothetical protein [Caudoviricetes sp.]
MVATLRYVNACKMYGRRTYTSVYVIFSILRLFP